MATEPEPNVAQLADRINDLVTQVWLASERGGPRFDDVPLTAQQQAVLALVARDPAMTPHRLADEMGVSRGAVSQHLAALEREGYLTRRRSETDRRVTVFELLGPGLTYRRQYLAFERYAADVYAAHLSREDLVEVVAALTKLAEAFTAEARGA